MHFYVCVGGETAFFRCLISAMEIKCIFFVHVSSFCWCFQSATTLVSMHILEIKAASCVPECKATKDLRILTINELIYRHQHKRAALSRHSGVDFHRLSTKFDSFSSRTISVLIKVDLLKHTRKEIAMESGKLILLIWIDSDVDERMITREGSTWSRFEAVISESLLFDQSRHCQFDTTNFIRTKHFFASFSFE